MPKKKIIQNNFCFTADNLITKNDYFGFDWSVA